VDTSSLSNPQSILVTHLSWTARVDFKNSLLSAKATYDLNRFDPSETTLCLDTSHLTIDDVYLYDDDGVATNTTSYELENPSPHLGQRLKIQVGRTAKKVTIAYRTTEKSSASQWLPPSQTAGKKHPYLFTQCQAIHARSLVPCQDQPGVKMTYSAEVTVPSWATCIMSALHVKDTVNDSEKTCTWDQPVPISSYLLAMAVGDLKAISISDRVRIWSEPSVVEAAAYEFAETEQFLNAAEAITGRPYAWGRYDLLCLPPSFPYGGMENPCLTFVTPTLLAGDRSLADVVAHEIAHSWTGNLVTNATWEHFWLNEGWTMWLQRKIMTRITNDDNSIDFDAIGGWGDLEDSVKSMPDDFSRLVPILGDRDPDDAFSSIPYEKGFNLLYSLEHLVGSVPFESFFQAYVEKFAFHTITSDEFREFFLSYFPGAGVDWNTWFHTPGMPLEKPDFDRSLSAASEELAEAWVAVDRKDAALPTGADLKGWTSNQIVCFLNKLQSLTETEPLKVTTIAALNKRYAMAESRNSEILFRYCMLAVAAEDESILTVATRFITTQGRMKFVRPLYGSLFRSSMGKKLAVETFLENKDFYHPICAKMVATDLSIKREGSHVQSFSWYSACLVVAAAASIDYVILRPRR